MSRLVQLPSGNVIDVDSVAYVATDGHWYTREHEEYQGRFSDEDYKFFLANYVRTYRQNQGELKFTPE